MPKKIKKSGTMQQAITEGEGYLKRSWDQEKYNRIQNIHQETGPDNEITKKITKKRAITDDEPSISSKKPKLAKHTTMVQTTKESEIILKDSSIDVDAKTRNQSKLISKLVEKKPRLVKNRTMKKTAAESEYFLQNSKIDENSKTRSQSKAVQKKAELKNKLKKNSTMTATTKEALDLLTKEPLKPRSASKKK